MKNSLVPAISICTIMAGCVSTPEPNPVAMIQSGDEQMSCESLSAEYRGNTEAAARKIARNRDDDKKDVAVGLLIWPGLADFNNAPGHEGNALLDRNSRLKSLAEMHECNTEEWPEQPKRY